VHVQDRDEFCIVIKYDIVSCSNIMINTTLPFNWNDLLPPHAFPHIGFAIKLGHILFGHIYFSAIPPKAATQYKVAIFVNNNNYICHSVHMELRVRAAATSAAF